MNQSYIDIFDEKDVIEENKLQTVLTGSKKNAPDQLVLINRFKKTSDFNIAFKEILENAIQQKLHIEENEEEIILVTKEIVGENLTLFLSFANITEEKRFDYIYEYLHQAVAYIAFDNYLINILIGHNQVVFKDDQLYLKESIIIDRRIDKEMQFNMVAKKIGHTIDKILCINFKELHSTKKYDEIKRFSDKLIQRNNSYECIDDIFSAFKFIYFDEKLKNNGLLIGKMHPNNMLSDSVTEKAEPPVIIEEATDVFKEIDSLRMFSTEVTSAERQILTGITNEEREILTSKNPVEEENAILDDTENNDFNDGPTEESIDLSKLFSYTQSFEDIIVRETEVVTYGVPESLKNKSFSASVKKYNQKENKSSNDKLPKIKKNTKLNAMVIAAIILIFMFISFLIIPNFIDNDTGEPKRPEAFFEINIQGTSLFCNNLSKSYNDEEIVTSYFKIERDNIIVGEESSPNKANFDISGLTEGVYNFTLIVTDSAGRSSDPFRVEKVYSSSDIVTSESQDSSELQVSSDETSEVSNSTSDDEILNGFELSTTINATEDFSIQYTGDKSIKANLSENNGTASLSFDNVDIQNKSTISFWLMSDKKEPISIQLIGYNGNENVFSTESEVSPEDLLSWNIFSTEINMPNEYLLVDNFVIRLTSAGSLIWFDDLSINN